MVRIDSKLLRVYKESTQRDEWTISKKWFDKTKSHIK